MELQQESSKVGALPVTTSRNPSSSSSAFLSANQSPFFSPRSSKSHGSESTRTDDPNPSLGLLLGSDSLACGNLVRRLESLSLPISSISSSKFEDPVDGCKIPDCLSSSSSVCNGSSSNCSPETSKGYAGQREKQKRKAKTAQSFSISRASTLVSSTKRIRSCDVYIGFHGRKPSLLRFTKWLRAELEFHGISCFTADRERCRCARSHENAKKAMNTCTFGVVILTKKSFGNPYSIEELVNFLDKKNLIPIFFDLSVNDCLARDIVEQRGELWEKHGGELWMLYGGLEREWREALDGLIRMDDWKLEALEGNWRDCILNAVILLATRLGRRSAVDRVNRWKERVEKEELPFPRNEEFVGRRKELSELELILFGDVSGDGEREYFELKTRRRRKSLVNQKNESKRIEESAMNHQSEGIGKGKEPVIWKESERDIEMQKVENPERQFPSPKVKGGKYGRRKKTMKILYGKGIACVSGDSGIGKTELVLEYAYRFSQRYKMVLWVGGETRYIRQNYLNLHSFLEIDVSTENHSLDKGRTKCFEEQEEEAIARVRKEFMRDIPFLVVIDNLENEKDWWDRKSIMDLLPRFGGETHFIITTRLPRVMNLEPMKLSFLSGMEAVTVMKGSFKDYPITEVDALRIIEEKLGRLTLGFGIVGAILSEISISPSRLLDTVNRIPLRDLTWKNRESPTLRKHTFLMQLLEVCFSIFDQADGPRGLATRMVQVSGWFAPAAIPIPMLSMAAHRVPDKHHQAQFWKKCLRIFRFCCSTSQSKRSDAEASSMLVRFGVARRSTRPECIHVHELIKLYARKRGTAKAAQAVIQAASIRGSISQHPEHLWAACFLLFGFGADPVVVEPKPSELLFLVKHVVLPLAIHTFVTFSRCNAVLELLRLSTDALEVAAESLQSQSEKWLDKSHFCGRPIQSDPKYNFLWQELALLKARVLETRTKLLLRGGQYDVGDGLIRKAIFIRTSICGENHPDTVAAKETLSKLTRLLTSVRFS